MSTLTRVLLGLLLLGIGCFLALEGIVIAGSRSDLKDDPDAVIILGCKIWGEEPSPALRRRLDTALDYLEELESRGVCPVIVVSGGQGDDEPISEAQSMADYLTAHGVEKSRIFLEDQSTNTLENLKDSSALLAEQGIDGGHLTVVSNGFHLTRVRLLAGRLGLDCSTLSAPMPDWPSRIYSTVREAFALVKSFLLDR
ncbi:MAG: YdcF family protein [Clostridiales bacterium]|nr:YdcF family protein [Clostridiales bacterium]